MALTKYAKEWGDVYNKAETIFHRDINAVKKTDKKMGDFLAEELEPIRKPVGLLGALIAVDKVDLAKGSAKELAALPGNIKLFKAAMVKLDAEVKKLDKVLVAAQKLQPTMKDKNGLLTPNRIKDWLPDSYRQLKMLETELNAIFARAQMTLAGAVNDAEVTKINAAKDKATGKVDVNDEASRKAIEEEANMKKLVLQFGVNFKSSMAKGAAVIQRIKASPDAVTYNKEMNNGGRDISQNLVNIVKLKANPKMKSSTLAKKLPDPGQLAKDITPFANGDKRNVDQNATPDQVKALLVEFTKLYKKIAETYADVISGKLA